MKKRFLPLAFLSLFSGVAGAQIKAEGSDKSLDIKTPYFESFLENPRSLGELENTTGMLQGRFQNNSLYVIRNGLLNHTYGGNLDVRFLQGYTNFTDQSKRNEAVTQAPSPIGEIITRTTLREQNKSEEQGFSVGHRGFLVSYENAISDNNLEGSTLITIGENSDLISFSSGSRNSTTVFTAGVPYGYVKIIQSHYLSREDSAEKEGELVENFLLNVRYALKFEGKERAKISLFHGGNLDSGKDDFGNISGFVWGNLFRDIDATVFYDSGDGKFKVNLSTSKYSKLNQRNFERDLENRLRLAQRIYDAPLEREKRYLEDMFFTEFKWPFGYNFSIDEDRVAASVNAKYLLLHYSPESQAAGVKYRFGIGTYDFKSKEARIGIFFGK